MEYTQRIEKAKNIAELFSLVQEIVQKYLRREQAGLLIGITDLGSYPNGFLGAFYSLNANMILINKKPLQRVSQTNPSLYPYYLFHVLLHEYVHAIGAYDEQQARQLVYEISSHYFGQEHILTEFATHIEKFIPQLTYPSAEFQPPEDLEIEFVMGIDKRNTNYIQ